MQTVAWAPSGALRIIDQRRLPGALEYRDLASLDDVADAIRTLAVRGAPAIGVAAAMGLAAAGAAERSRGALPDAAGARRFLEAGAALLRGTRPTAVNLMWALDRMLEALQRASGSAEQLVAAMREEAERIRADDVAMCEALGRHGRTLLKDGMRVLTHCNAGALATAGHGTALGVIRSAVAAGKRISVIADETRPFLQGARLTAWEMVQENIPLTLITDNMAGHLMAQGEIDAVIVGTDRVAANGDVANKIGTYMVAVLAARHRIPFYVACPLSTIDLSVPSGREIPIEERAASEVTGFRDAQWAAAGVKVRNPSFDVTPAELVTALITERGIVIAPDAQKLRALFD